jgi:hypothetical protein
MRHGQKIIDALSSLASFASLGDQLYARFNGAQSLTSAQKSRALQNVGAQPALGFAPVQQGTGIGQNLNNTVKIGWTGAQLKATVDVTDMGGLWCDFVTSKSFATPGYHKFPNGLLIQWGTSVITTDYGGTAAIVYPAAFPNAMLTTIAWNGDSNATPTAVISNYRGGIYPGAGVFAIRATNPSTGEYLTVTTLRIDWLAIGY